MRTLLSTVTLVASLAGVACGPPPHTASADEVELAPSEQRQQLADALSQLRADPLSDDVATELERTAGWLEQAEQILTDEGDEERVRVLLTGAEAQLGAVKAYYTRSRAERDLEALKKRLEEEE